MKNQLWSVSGVAGGHVTSRLEGDIKDGDLLERERERDTSGRSEERRERISFYLFHMF